MLHARTLLPSLAAAAALAMLVLVGRSADAQSTAPTSAPAPSAKPAASAAPAAAAAPAPRGPLRVLVIDLERAVYETEDGLRVEALLRRLGDIREHDYETAGRRLEAEQNQLRNELASGKVTQAAAQPRAEGLQKKFMELQGMRQAIEDDMDRRRDQLSRPIFDKVRRIVARLAQEHGNAVVVDRSASPALPKGAVAFVRDELEITDRVIKLYNADPVHSAAAPPKK